MAECADELSIEGRPVLDLSRSGDRARADTLFAFAGSQERPPVRMGLESRERMLARLTRASIVTDDNMLPEWRTLILGQ